MKISFHKIFIFLIFVIYGAAAFSESRQVLLDEIEFSYALPHEWTVKDADRKNGIFQASLYDSEANVVQLTVMKPNKGVSVDTVRKSLKKGLGAQKVRGEWILVDAKVLNVVPFGEVHEEIYVSKDGLQISITKNVFGDTHIALFTTTINVNSPSGAKERHHYIKGFSWKKKE